MGYKLRKIEQGQTCHITSQCHGKKHLMNLAKHKQLFENIINWVIIEYPFELIGYVVMSNHFHLVIRSIEGGPTISKIMQVFKSMYAREYNKRFNRSGSFWHARFSDKIVEVQSDPECYLKWLLWYLAFNPVRARMANNPRDYKYGSINAYLDEEYEPRVPITRHDYFLDLGKTFKKQVKRFLLYEEIYKDVLYTKYNIRARY